ncbi:hypothetical protein H5410_004609 [Solanum commersonii]|uniref:Uncharacterized protein n=1 Tax=Solanum commersonii TaxID=4109 RepID=A0A9J6B8L7_SOLCO|nr:hypothetical protein H5410_004609 [Solanum commersonii]
MQTRGRNRLDFQLQNDEGLRQYVEQLMDERNIDQAQPYIEQLINSENHNQTQDHDDQSNELTNSAGGTDESGNLEARKVRGPTLLKDIWKLPPGETVDVPFNSRNQAIGKEGRKLSIFLGIIARTPELTPLHVDDWRNFNNEEKKKLLNFVRRRTQANRNNRTKQKMPHTGGSKSIATMMDEHVLGNERSGYVRGLGLGPTPSSLWGSRSFLENIDEEDSSNEIVQRLQMRQFMRKHAPNESMPQNINGTSSGQVHDDSGHGQIAPARGVPIVAENTPTSHGITHLYPSMRLFELLFESKFISIVAHP